MTLRLRDVTPDMVVSHYTPAAAAAVNDQLREFRQFEDNFPPAECYFAPGRDGTTLLHIAIKLRVDPARAGPAAAAGDAAVAVDLTYPAQFPMQVVVAQVEAPPPNPAGRLRIKQHSLVMDREGVVKVDGLQTLRGSPRPFPLIDVLLALMEQFSVEFPYVTETEAAQSERPAGGNGAAAVASALMGSVPDPQRSAKIQEAAEKVVIDLHTRAGSYLETREKALYYLQCLNENNRDLTKAKEVLQRHQQELESYVPKAGDVNALVKQLEAVPNTVDEHSRCLVAQTETQEKALELMAEIHASEDVLALLEDGLKNDYFTVDEYIKCVTDVGREQFTARFLCHRVLEELKSGRPDARLLPGPSGSNTSVSMGEMSPPQVPHRISQVEALEREFPMADPDIVRDVMLQVSNDISSARRQLRSMFGQDG